MEIKKAEFLMSNTLVSKCPEKDFPEYAFIGRSNVGKSSLINMITNHKKLAKTSGKPGKTRLINHFLIDNYWYLVDLPGYGYAKVSKTDRAKFHKLISNYISKREQLVTIFVLLDSRIEPQKSDLEFMEMLGINNVPFAMVFTKAEKLTPTVLKRNQDTYRDEMLKTWEELPPIFITSATSKLGKEELLDYIDGINKQIEADKAEGLIKNMSKSE